MRDMFIANILREVRRGFVKGSRAYSTWNSRLIYGTTMWETYKPLLSIRILVLENKI